MPDLAWPDSTIVALQDKYSVSLTFTRIEPLSPMILEMLFGPLGALYIDSLTIDPHWYLKGVDLAVTTILEEWNG